MHVTCKKRTGNAYVKIRNLCKSGRIIMFQACISKAFDDISKDGYEKMLTIHIRNAAYVSLANVRTALNLFRAYVIWMREITAMKEVSCIVPKHWRRVMIAVIFM